MKIETLFLNEKELWQLSLLRQVMKVEKEEISIRKIADELESNYGKVRANLLKLSTELEELFGKKVMIVEKSLLHFFYEEEVLTRFQEKMIERSLPFQFLQATLSLEPIYVEDFCKNRDVNRSTLSISLSTMREFCKQHGLKLHFSPLRLVGSEVTIRLFLSFVYLLVFNGKTMYPDVNEHKEKRLRESAFEIFEREEVFISESMKNSFYFVFRRRQEQGCYFTPTSKMKNFANKLRSRRENLPMRYFRNNPKIAEDETMLLFLLAHLLKYERRTMESILTGENTLQFPEEVLGRNARLLGISTQLIDYLHHAFFYVYKKRLPFSILREHVYCQMYIFYIWQEHKLLTESDFLLDEVDRKSHERKMMRGEIEKFFHAHFVDLRILFPQLENDYFVQKMQEMLERVNLNRVANEPFVVGFALSPTHPFYLQIIKEITTMKGVEVQPLSNHYQAYDLVIYSSEDNLKNVHCPLLYKWENRYGEKEMRKLSRVVYEVRRRKG